MTRKKVQGTKLWRTHGKVFVSSKGQVPMIEWYHNNLQHAGVERLVLTMRQYFDWPDWLNRYIDILKAAWFV